MTVMDALAEAAEARMAQDLATVYLPMAHRWVHDAQTIGPLHLPREQRHDHPGWLTALPTRDLATHGIPVTMEEQEFEVPLDCPWWHDAERLPDGRVFRFFAKRAWLDLPAKPDQKQIVFHAMFAIEPSTLWELEVHADGRPMRRVSLVDQGRGIHELVYERMDKATTRRVELIAPVADVVSKRIMDANDHRYLSLAVTQPRWTFACRR